MAPFLWEANASFFITLVLLYGYITIWLYGHLLILLYGYIVI
jgi:hypothetical protein